MGILYESRKKIEVDEKSWYEVYEYFDSGCYPGCGLNVSIDFCKLRPMTEGEKMNEIQSLNRTIEALTRKLSELKAHDLRKPDFKSLQKLVSSTRRGTPEHEEARRKLKKAHRDWARIKKLMVSEKSIRKQLEGTKKRLKKVVEGVALKKTQRHLLSRCFFWDDADDEVDPFINRFVYDPEFRRQSIEGEAEWCHVNRIYTAAADILYSHFSTKPHFLGYTVGDKRAEREYKKLSEQFDVLCESVYEFVKEHVNELTSNPEYRKALEKENLKEFVKTHVLSRIGHPSYFSNL